MKKYASVLLALALALLTACGKAPTPSPSDTTTVACTTYPVYLLTQAVAAHVPDTEVELVINQQLSCLHNYTLTMSDMKTIASADLLVINGAGLESFLEDVLDLYPYLDASEGLELRWNEEEGETDPHCWLDPTLAGQMAQNIADGLSETDSVHAERYQANADAICVELADLQETLKLELAPLSCREIIPFHDGFSYFADAFGLDILASVEEEEGSEASARQINELSELIRAYNIPCVFIEKNGSDSAARALSQECGIQVAALDMGMSGDETGGGLAAYEALLRRNIDTIREAYT